MPKVSIIIPAYNSEQFLNRTIQSVVNQTYKDWELLVVDDGSTDNTKEIIKGYEQKDKRIKGIFLEKNSGGPAHPRNVGIQNSKGEYVAFLDHDDEWLPEKLGKQIKFIKENGFNFITCDSLIFKDNIQIGVYRTPKLSLEVAKVKILEGNFIHSCSSILLNRRIFDEISYFDEKLRWSDDWDFYIRSLFAGYNIEVIKEFLFKWHSQKQSTGKILPYKAKTEELFYFLEKHKEKFALNQNAFLANKRHLAAYFILSGQYSNGRKIYSYLLDKKISIKVLLLYALSFLGKNVFEVLLNFRKKISNKILDKT